ncbi:MAG: conserved hypothetical protein [Methanobrevibacter sp. CfCl-M3]
MIILIIYLISCNFYAIYFIDYSDRIDPSLILVIFFSLLWGPIGTIGTSVGELISNLYNSQINGNLYLFMAWHLTVFFIGYFSYKIYYAFNFKNKHEILQLNDFKSLIKFVIVTCITSIFSSYIYFYIKGVMFNVNGLGIKQAWIDQAWNDSIFFIMLNHIFFILLISILNLTNQKLYEPKKSKHFLKHVKIFNIFIFLSSLILIINITTIDHLTINRASLIFLNLIFIMSLVILKPITKDIEVKKNNVSFNEFIIFIVIILYTIPIIVRMIYGFISNLYNISSQKLTIPELINYFFGYEMLIQLIFTFIFILIIINYVQKRFSKPLYSINEIIEDYISVKTNYKADRDQDHENIGVMLNKLKSLSNTKYEIGSLAVSFEQMIKDVEIYISNLKKVTSENEKITTELNIASDIQKSAIPNIFPPFPDRLDDFDIYGSFNPAYVVGGDFYDYFLIDDNHLVIVIGDVSGKGVPAALFMMMVKTLIKDQLKLGLKPSEVFIKINNELNENNNEGMFVTVWLGLLNINSGEMTYVNAGHPKPFLFNKSRNQYNILESKPDFVLGGMENMKYKSFKITINAGDRLYLFTDGITESINQNEEEFQIKRLGNVLNENHALKIEDLIPKVSKVLHSFTKGVEQFDDETMLILEYRKEN